MSTQTNISNYERQRELSRLIERNGRVSVTQICEQFGISKATARRDLEVLTEQGFIQRVHGGGVLMRQAPEESILSRTHEQEKEKEDIGRVAASLVRDGETVFLGSGTTVLQVAQHLLNQNITVITNSLPAINALAGKANISLVALGGVLRESEFSFIGHITEQALVEVRADKVIVGIRAISLSQGLTNDYLPETMTDRAIMNIGSKLIVVADHTKCDRISTVFVVPLEKVDVLVTSKEAPEKFLQAVQEKGIQVLVA
jgi:DeoR/GlpR family transcriptional regulator of sugar metabolism